MKGGCPLPDLEYAQWAKMKGIPVAKVPDSLPAWKDFRAEHEAEWGLKRTKYTWLKMKASQAKLNPKQLKFMKNQAKHFEGMPVKMTAKGLKKPDKTSVLSMLTPKQKAMYESASPVLKKKILAFTKEAKKSLDILAGKKVAAKSAKSIKAASKYQSWAEYKLEKGLDGAPLSIKKEAKFKYLVDKQKAGQVLSEKQTLYVQGYSKGSEKVLKTKASKKLSKSPFTPDEKDTIADWKSGSNSLKKTQLARKKGYGVVNERRVEQDKIFENMFKRLPKYKDIVWRGDSLKAAQIPKVGKIQKWNTNHCTSKSKNVAGRFAHNVVYRIQPKNAIDISKVDGFRSEREVLGMKGAKYKCLKVSKGTYGFRDHVTVIEMLEL